MTQACGLGATLPGRRRGGVRPTCRRCGCSVLGAVGTCRSTATGPSVEGSEMKPFDVASPSVANSSAVSTAPRTNSRNERLCGRRDAVSGGNMCSETYDRDRTEPRKIRDQNRTDRQEIALDRGSRGSGLQAILQEPRGDAKTDGGPLGAEPQGIEAAHTAPRATVPTMTQVT